MTTAATAAVAADAVTAAADTTTEVVETIIDNSGKTLAFVAAVAAGALAVGWLVRQYGERAMEHATAAGLLDPPFYAEPAAAPPEDDDHEDDDQGADEQPETGDGSWAQ